MILKQPIHRTVIEFHHPYDPSSPNSLMAAMTKSADTLEAVKKTGATVTKAKSNLTTIVVEDAPK